MNEIRLNGLLRVANMVVRVVNMEVEQDVPVVDSCANETPWTALEPSTSLSIRLCCKELLKHPLRGIDPCEHGMRYRITADTPMHGRRYCFAATGYVQDIRAWGSGSKMCERPGRDGRRPMIYFVRVPRIVVIDITAEPSSLMLFPACEPNPREQP